MEGLRKGKGICLLAGIIIAFGILMSGISANAQDNFFSATLLRGQSTGNQGFSSVTPFGLASIAVTSIGNRTATSSLSVTSGQSGLWTLFLFGTGGGAGIGFSAGVSPFSGQNAQIDINNGIAFVWAFGSVLILDGSVTAEAPITFNMSVGTGG